MHIEYWSREEIGAYCEHPNLLIAKANELRRKILLDLLVQAARNIAAALKQLAGSQYRGSSNPASTTGAFSPTSTPSQRHS